MPSGTSLPKLVSEVEDALSATAEAARLLHAVDLIRARPRLLRSHLSLLLGCEQCLERVAARSSWHENGFAKIRLAVRTGYSVRLHVWPPSDRWRGDVNPHGHRWEFASWVAVGVGLDETYYAEDPGRIHSSATYGLCAYGPVDGVRTLTRVGKARLYVRDRVRHPAGATYACPRDVVHTVVPVDREFVATVVLQGPVLAETTPVYLGPSGAVATYRRMSAHELRELLGSVAALLPADDRDGALEAAP
jgi:hypothetical protein